MRCYCCNRNLNDYESTLRDTEGNFLDTCGKCLKGLGIETLGRTDLNKDDPAPVDWDEEVDNFLDHSDLWEEDEE